ncbi:MAG: EthD family reductase [Chloroflexaceae bacterium]|nr:EthD family reductase [Chloroflexaceae bacterium]
MIHQIIFAAPKPGMTTKEFQDYWINVHAANYASKIPQIKRYLIDARIPFDGDIGNPILPHQGVAEIWLPNEEEQLASLQTEEFLQGARLDEPNWAAFWMTFLIDTTAHVIIEGPPLTQDPTWIKMILLYKRTPGIPLENFRQYGLNVHAPRFAELPGLRRYLQCHTKDGFYVIGESAAFDAAEFLWFDNTDALQQAMNSQQFKDAWAGLDAFVNPQYRFSIVAQENWIIGPEVRP